MALLGGIFVLVEIILGFLSIGSLNIPFSSPGIGLFEGLVSLIITGLAAVGLIMMYGNRFDIKEEWLEGVVIIILGLLANSTLGLIGGILVLISAIL